MKFFTKIAEDRDYSNIGLASAAVGTGLVGSSVVNFRKTEKSVKPLVSANTQFVFPNTVKNVDTKTTKPLVFFTNRDTQADAAYRSTDMSKQFPNAQIINNAKNIGVLDDKLLFYEQGGIQEHMPKTISAKKISSTDQLDSMFPRGYIAKKRVAFAGKGVHKIKSPKDAIKFIGDDSFVFQELLPQDSFRNEYRVIAANGKVIKVQGRTTGGNLYPQRAIPFTKADAINRENAKFFVENEILPKLKIQPKGVQALDVLYDDNRGLFKVLENDVGISSSTRWSTNKKYIDKVLKTGKTPIGPLAEYKAFRRGAAGAALVAAGGGYLLSKGFKKEAKKEVDKTDIALAGVGAAGAAGVGYGLYSSQQVKRNIPNLNFKPQGQGRTLIFAIDPKAGAGHKLTADSLQAAFGGPSRADVRVLEDYALSPKIKELVTKKQEQAVGLHGKVSKVKSGLLYNESRNILANNFDHKRFMSDIAAGGYDRVVVTQSRPARFLHDYLGIKPEMVISDYSNTPRWLEGAPHVSRYHTPELNYKDVQENYTGRKRKKAQTVLKHKGNIIPSIPVNPTFYDMSVPPTPKDILGMSTNKKNIFIFGGGSGSYVEEAAENAAKVLKDLKLDSKYQLNVVAGARQSVFDNLKKIESNSGGLVKVLTTAPVQGKAAGFHTDIKSVMRNADLNIIRTGGPSLTEAGLVGKPMAGYVTNTKRDDIGRQIVDNINLTGTKMVDFRNQESLKKLILDYESAPDQFVPKFNVSSPYKAIIDNPVGVQQKKYVTRVRKPISAPVGALAELSAKKPITAPLGPVIEKLRAPGLIGAGLLAGGTAGYAIKRFSEKKK
jgi:hypothetical protein